MVYNERLAWKPYRLQPSKNFGWVARNLTNKSVISLFHE